MVEIEQHWSFEDIRKGLAYIDMKATIDKAVQVLLMPKDNHG